MTSVWCGEDGWGYLTVVTDCFCRSVLGRSFMLRATQPGARDGLVDGLALRPRPREAADVVCRHDNWTQFTSVHYREVADVIGVKLSRTRYRHPAGNALV